MHLSYLILDWSRNGVKSQKNCSQNCPPIPLTWEKLFSQMSLFGGVVRRYELPQTAFMCSYSSLVESMDTKMPCWNGSMASLRSFPTKLMFDTIFFPSPLGLQVELLGWYHRHTCTLQLCTSFLSSLCLLCQTICQLFELFGQEHLYRGTQKLLPLSRRKAV